MHVSRIKARDGAAYCTHTTRSILMGGHASKIKRLRGENSPEAAAPRRAGPYPPLITCATVGARWPMNALGLIARPYLSTSKCTCGPVE